MYDFTNISFTNFTKDNVRIVINTKTNKILALVSGNLYDVNGFPFEDGRRLREDNRNTIRELVNDNKDAIEELIRSYSEKSNPTPAPQRTFADALQDAFLNTLTEKAASDMSTLIYPEVEKMVIDKFGVLPKQHEIKVPDRPDVKLEGVLHKDFDKIVSIIMDNESVYLCGPAGTGKSYLSQQVAKSLNLEFYYTNSVTDEVQLKGFIDANGRYHETQFYKAFSEGGLFLLDELDASVPETLVILNNALANGYFAFPCGKITAHPDFHCIAAGNTFGTGADNMYTGRFQLDASSMDRFAMIMVDYDNEIELNMANGDHDLVNFAHSFRKAVEEVGTTCLCTYRAIKRLAKFSAYMEKVDALRIALVKGLSNDDLTIITKKMDDSSEWTKALKKLAAL